MCAITYCVRIQNNILHIYMHIGKHTGKHTSLRKAAAKILNFQYICS